MLRPLVMAVLACCACSMYTPPKDPLLRRVEVGGPAAVRPRAHSEIELDDQKFYIGEWLHPEVTLAWFAGDGEPVHRRTTISIGHEWQIECETIQSLEAGESLTMRTTNLETACTSLGKPHVELFMEGLDAIDGLVIGEAREYRITIHGDDVNRAILLERDGEPYLVVARGNRIWMRSGIPREERKLLLRVAAALWASAQVRET
jgi:hypothetical protein